MQSRSKVQHVFSEKDLGYVYSQLPNNRRASSFSQPLVLLDTPLIGGQ